VYLLHSFTIKTVDENGWALEDTRLHVIKPINGELHYGFISWYDDQPCRFRLIYLGGVLAINNQVTAAPVRNEVKEVTIYPNPSNGNLNIKAPIGKYQVTFVSVLGNFRKVYNHVGKIQTDLPNGSYWVVVEDEFGRRETKSLIIKK